MSRYDWIKDEEREQLARDLDGLLIEQRNAMRQTRRELTRMTTVVACVVIPLVALAIWSLPPL